MRHIDPSVGWDDPAYTQPPVEEGARPGRQMARLYVGLTILLACVYLWAIAVPGLRFFAWAASIAGLAVIGLIWLVLVGVVAVRLARGGGRKASIRRPLLVSLVVAPVVALLLWGARVGDLPLRIRVELSRGELTEYAESLLVDGRPDVVTPESVGGFPLRSVEVRSGAVLLHDLDGALFDTAGLLYIPEGSPEDVSGAMESPHFRSLGGGWWAFTTSW